MKPIIVATDFSSNALNAASYAADMALTINGYLIVLHVYHPPVPATEIPVFTDTALMLSGAEEEMKKLEKTLERRTSGKLIIETEVRVGTFFNELEAMCALSKPYAVVMGSQGTTAAEHFLFGTHAVYAMKHLDWPVITVPPNVKFSTVKRIGLATDLSEVADHTPVEEIKTLVHEFHAELHILNTAGRETFNPDIVFESRVIQKMLTDIKPVFHFIAHDNIDEGILDFIETNGIDLLIVMPKRHGLIDKLMNRSHTKQLVLHSHIPVMALHV